MTPRCLDFPLPPHRHCRNLSAGVMVLQCGLMGCQALSFKKISSPLIIKEHCLMVCGENKVEQIFILLTVIWKSFLGKYNCVVCVCVLGWFWGGVSPYPYLSKSGRGQEWFLTKSWGWSVARAFEGVQWRDNRWVPGWQWFITTGVRCSLTSKST